MTEITFVGIRHEKRHKPGLRQPPDTPPRVLYEYRVDTTLFKGELEQLKSSLDADEVRLEVSTEHDEPMLVVMPGIERQPHPIALADQIRKSLQLSDAPPWDALYDQRPQLLLVVNNAN